MTGGMVAMQSRVSELQAMLGLTPAGVLGGASSTSATSATGDFAGLLADALGCQVADLGLTVDPDVIW